MTRAASRRALALVAVVAGMAVSQVRAADATFARPGLLTAVGQSSDVAIVKALLNAQPRLDLAYKPVAWPADLAGVKTLVMVLGASTKGLGAAGLDMDKEAVRTRALLKAAKDRGVKVIAVHAGGESRRGKTSDDVIALVVPEADYTVVVAAGNKDKLFNRLAAKRGAPVVEVETKSGAGDALKAVFK